MRKNSKADKTAGNEGIDNPTGSKMTGADKQGGAMRESSKQHTDRGMDNDRQQGRESTDNNAHSFGGQGGQREGAEEPEGTGYTNDTSHDTGDTGNPLN